MASNAAKIEMRPARAGEMRACANVFAHAVRDLRKRTGTPPSPLDIEAVAHRLGHLRRTDPKGFQVAVKDGRVVSFAATILREKIHFLAMFWMLPSLQSHGVGQKLLERAFAGMRPPPGTIRCVYASMDFRAQRLYNKFGMVPRSVIYGLGADKITLPKPPLTPVELVQVGTAAEASREALAIAAAIDRRVRGCRRDADIAFTLNEPGTRFFEAREEGDPVGYVAIMGDGMIGPGGSIDRRYNEGIAWSALAAAQEMGVKRIRMSLTGLNHEGLETAFRAGMKISFMGAWMSEREFGALDRYLATAGDIF